jgi:hypothetical protein
MLPTAHNSAMAVELLYFEGCPHGESYLPHLRQLIAHVERSDDVRLLRVEDDAGARAARFLGSPTVRVDGRDVEPDAADRTDYGMSCRLYTSSSGITGTPPDEWVLAALNA